MEKEEKGRIWYRINRVADDRWRGGVLHVDRMVNGELCTYTDQEDMVRCIQEETEVRFQLTHSAPIT